MIDLYKITVSIDKKLDLERVSVLFPSVKMTLVSRKNDRKQKTKKWFWIFSLDLQQFLQHDSHLQHINHTSIYSHHMYRDQNKFQTPIPFVHFGRTIGMCNAFLHFWHWWTWWPSRRLHFAYYMYWHCRLLPVHRRREKGRFCSHF